MTSDQIVLQAEKRAEFGKGPSHRLRSDGKLPVVVYGHGKDALPLVMDAIEVHNVIHHSGLLSIEVKGRKRALVAVIKDHQVHVPQGHLVHVDFQEVKADEVISVTVPLEAHGEPRGATEGGQLEQVMHELDIHVPANKIPEVIEVDVSGLELNAAMTVAELPLPEGVVADLDPEQVVFTCREPHMEEPEAEGEEGAAAEAGEGAEPEVIAKGKQEEEEETAE